MDTTTAAPLYTRIADEFAGLIREGRLRPGERLPSVRRLSAQQGVSISTALSALEALERQGLVEARPQSGYYARRPAPTLPEPDTTKPARAATWVGRNALFAQSVWARNGKRPGVGLGAAIPAPELFPEARLKAILASTARRTQGALTRYHCSSAQPSLQHEIARRYLQIGCTLDESEIIVTHGCTEALNVALRATTAPGDTVAVESPAYFGFLQILESLRLKALEIPTHPRDGVSVEALELAFRTGRVKACLLIPNANNPLGFTMPDERKRRLVALAAQHRIPLIEDDIYGDLHYAGPRPKPLRSFDRAGNVLLCTSYTKTVAPGLRVGALVPGRFFDAAAMLRYRTSISTGELAQATIAAFLGSGGFERHLRRLRAAFAAQLSRLSEAVSASFPEGTRITRPAGGFVLWVELPPAVDAVALSQRALKDGIDFAPGPMFSATGQFGNCLRLSCGNPWSPVLATAVDRLGILATQASARGARRPPA